MAELFTRLERAAWGGFIAAQSRLFGLIEEDLRRHFHITHAEFEVLLRLWLSDAGRVRIQDLAAQSLLSRSGTSRAVERLVRAGHLEREDAEEDGRGAYAVLTRRGKDQFMAAARQHVELVRREYLSHFTQAEQEQLAGYWERLLPRREPAQVPPGRRKKATAATRRPARERT